MPQHESPVVVEGASSLTDAERAERAALEHFVEQPSLARGFALRQIRNKRLYRETHETFELYCQERFRLTRQRVHQLIQAAKVVANLSTVVDSKQLNERQARALAPLGPDEQRVVYELARQTAPARRVTASHLKSLVTVVQGVVRAGAIDDGSGAMVLWDGLPPERQRALLEANLTEETYERHQRQRDHVNRILRSSNTQEWYTPRKYIEAARMVLGEIDLDPASCEQANRTVKATTFFDAASDGLRREWPGRVWLNPPYGGLAGPFVERLITQVSNGTTTAAIVLVNAAATDTVWFQVY